MKKLKFLFLLIFTLSLLLSLCQNAFALDDPDIKAKSVILAEVNSGKIMYEKNADVQVDPASITKLTTVLLAVEEYEKGNISLDEKITVSETANFDITEDSSTQNIKAGEEMSFKDVLYCALVASANEACNILAERVSGSVDAFVKVMNTRVKQLGCTGTNYVNTHGLTAEGHKTTARDVYLILNEAIKHPLMRQIMETRTYIVQATNTSERRSLENTNMLINPSSEYYYENCKGGKTGTTTAAGFCLASYAADDNMTLISVVMGAESVQLDTGYMQMQNFS